MEKTSHTACALALIGLVATWQARALADAPQASIRVLVVTGGHDFEREPFFAMLDECDGVEYREVAQPEANECYTVEEAEAWDVLLLYDMTQAITEEQMAALLSRVSEGKGVVALHHSLASYDAWPEWEKLLGGHYYQAPWERDGVEQPRSTYRHDVEVRVSIADPDHPITRGISDFTLHDEVYGGFAVDPGVHVLLTTDHPESGPVIGWTNTYGQGRVVYIQPGHGPQAYEDANYRALVSRAIRWAAGEG